MLITPKLLVSFNVDTIAYIAEVCNISIEIVIRLLFSSRLVNARICLPCFDVCDGNEWLAAVLSVLEEISLNGIVQRAFWNVGKTAGFRY